MMHHLACLNDDKALIEFSYSIELGFLYFNFIQLFIYVSAFFPEALHFQVNPYY